MNATPPTLATYVRTARHPLGRVPHGYQLCVVDQELLLVPVDLLRVGPGELTEADRRRIRSLGEIGLSEAA